MASRRRLGVVLLVMWIAIPAAAQVSSPAPPLDQFFKAASRDERVSRAALDALSKQWRDSFTPMIIDMARLLRPAPADSVDGADLTGSPNDAVDPDDAGGAVLSGAGLG